MANRFYGVQCVMCGEVHWLNCTEAEANKVAEYMFRREQDRTSVPYIQDALPFLSADDREILISGICPKCYKKMFSFFEDEDEEVG